MNDQQLKNPQVGEILKEEFLEEIGISQDELFRRFIPPSARQNVVSKDYPIQGI